jgi:hypothetical protein
LIGRYHLYRIAEQFAVLFQPDLADPLIGKQSLLSFLMQPQLKAGQNGLAEWWQ